MPSLACAVYYCDTRALYFGAISSQTAGNHGCSTKTLLHLHAHPSPMSSIICNVHGVKPKFIEIEKRKQEQLQQQGNQAFTKGAYYIGKMVCSKGYRELLQLLWDHQDQLSYFQVDLYGNGEDSDRVYKDSRKLQMAVEVNPGRDRANPLFY